MGISISSLNALCGVDCDTKLSDYANIFSQKYSQQIFASSLQAFHGEFSHKPISPKLRLRGIGHSMHGRSLPTVDESLVSTCNMNSVRVLDQFTLEVECGVQIGRLNAFLNQYNCRLPIIHSGGYGGPSVAGYFLAGGIGEDSREFGGFWSNVDEILWTDYSTNESTWYSQTKPQFWHISGSGGQLDGFLEKLRIRFFISKESSIQTMPSAFKVSPQSHPFEEPIVWWTIFCATPYERQLMKSMRTLAPALIPFVSLVPPRKIAIKKTNVYPEFLSRFDESLCAVSIGGTLLGDRLNSAYRATSIIEDVCEQQSPFLVPYSSSELSLQSFN
ncbi:MAG: hypothetical protein CMM07_19735 [Rhodopirellula sp.]|nr:hypothetical protein [Rhodopirellula sp.]